MSTRAKILLTVALARYLRHFHAPDAAAPLWEWCMYAIRSADRELRVAAGQAVPQFAADDRLKVFAVLEQLSHEAGTHMVETVVLAWAELGKLVDGDDLNMVLIKLVGYVGSANTFVAAAACHELAALARARARTPWQLFAPFLRTASILVVTQLDANSALVHRFARLLAVSVPTLLVRTQEYTVPYVLLGRHTGILERIAQAAGTSVANVCLNNIGCILAVLLTQSFDNVEAEAQRFLRDSVDDFRATTIPSLIRQDPLTVAVEVLKMFDADDETSVVDADAGSAKSRLLVRALVTIARTHQQATPTSRPARQTESVAQFFQTYVLGVVGRFADTVYSVHRSQAWTEKLRCLHGLAATIRIARGSAVSAVPQICACLQSALEDAVLQKAALTAWMQMLVYFDAKDVDALVPLTFSVVLTHWARLGAPARVQAREMVEYVIAHHEGVLRAKRMADLPSLRAVPELAPYEDQLAQLKIPTVVPAQTLDALVRRCRHENYCVVREALRELQQFLVDQQAVVCAVLASKTLDRLVARLGATLLDICRRFPDNRGDIGRLAAECLGWIGAVDPNKVDTRVDGDEVVVVHAFDDAAETAGFVLLFLDRYVVPAFRAATDTKSQSFLAYGMQELLKVCGLDIDAIAERSTSPASSYALWHSLGGPAKLTLLPMLTSRFMLSSLAALPRQTYPIFAPGKSHRAWLQALTTDLLAAARGAPERLFGICARVVRDQDPALCEFLVPFAALAVVIGADAAARDALQAEMLLVLESRVDDGPGVQQSHRTVFAIVDYIARWQRARRRFNMKTVADRAKRSNRYVEPEKNLGGDGAVDQAEAVLAAIPAELVGRRAYECQSYARALLYYEQYVRQLHKAGDAAAAGPVYRTLQQIYSKLDDPDAIEGVSTKFLMLDLDQQILEHEAAGRWSLAHDCWDLVLRRRPDDADAFDRLLVALRESGQYETLLSRLDGGGRLSRTAVDLGVEAAWVLGRWDALDGWLGRAAAPSFAVSVGRALASLRAADGALAGHLHTARAALAAELALSGATAPGQCQDAIFRLHALADLESMAAAAQSAAADHAELGRRFRQRLELLHGGYEHRRFLLDLRRTVAEICRPPFAADEVLAGHLAAAKMARKAGKTAQAYAFVLQAAQTGSPLAVIEHARLKWAEQQPRQALLILQDVIDSGALDHQPELAAGRDADRADRGNVVKAKAVLLHAKWFDAAGQSNWEAVLKKYKTVSTLNESLESGHYYTGKYYIKILNAQMALPAAKRNKLCATGEYHRQICRYYCRALRYGVKYVYQTLSKLLTVWLDFATACDAEPADGKDVAKLRRGNLDKITASIGKYLRLLPKYQFFAAFSQVISRICHPNAKVYDVLKAIIIDLVREYPSQALWPVLAIGKSAEKERAVRGKEILRQVLAGPASPAAKMVAPAQKLSEQLLVICNAHVPNRVTQIDLREFKVDWACLPCEIAMPTQANLEVTWPNAWGQVKRHNAFREASVTIRAVENMADVMNSLQKPRKITVYGSDGKSYAFLCKPRDDLRKDARLMEFDCMINLLLQKDADALRRQLGVWTYAVTPLNEDCGLIEWVPDVRTLRDILKIAYTHRGVRINFPEIKKLLDANRAARAEVFAQKVLPQFPPVLYEWFIETFPQPAAWLASRTAYARSAAVMSIVGYILGLGDRHCENILFHEVRGNVVHVDFSCLFEKGLDFEIPERVPFRLTQNMVDALGPYDYEGPFRHCCNVALRVLRANEESLIPVLETFLHDPLVEWRSTRRSGKKGSASSPEEALARISRRLQGLLADDSFPLGVEGQVDSLIAQATSAHNLAEMYIGWSPMW
ncbi:uncharacterized protein V1510DRAFT_372646 [Dipodascopsis tothii]|uniref:uncharacterized protein n=1 Tax=Dipodascopsis tothii TaxID=44089 RepID=UPI0034CF5817